jgi:hypothetical protein
MGKGKLLPYNRPWVRPFRPPWSWLHPVDSNVKPRRSALYLRSEIMYLMPGMKGIDSRRQCMLEALERSSHENGKPKQFSGFGSFGVHAHRELKGDNVSSHIFKTYAQVDSAFAEALANSSQDSFPVKRLYNLCNLYSAVWDTNSSRGLRGRSAGSGGMSIDGRGPFPYVDDRATVLTELTKNHILQTRHRVNSESHPKWAIRTIRRRRRKMLIKAKKRSISQEAIRQLQAKLIANKSSKKSS